MVLLRPSKKPSWIRNSVSYSASDANRSQIGIANNDGFNLLFCRAYTDKYQRSLIMTTKGIVLYDLLNDKPMYEVIWDYKHI